MKFIKPGEVTGVITAPPSKSVMQRVTIAAALAEGDSIITNPSFCDDALATLNVVEALGAKVAKRNGVVSIRGAGIGTPISNTLDCGESGTCLRMISAVAALFDKEFTITGKGTLLKRPVGMIVEPLRMLGVECSVQNGLPPIKIKGPIHGGKIKVDGSESSQFISGLLMALPLCKEDSDVEVMNLQSKQYVSMTEDILTLFGVRIKSDEFMERFLIHGNQRYAARKYDVDGDWSGAAFVLVAGAIAGQVVVRGLRRFLVQPDMKVTQALKDAGAKVTDETEEVSVQKADLQAFEFDTTNCPDLFPPLAVLACNCKGKSVIYGTNRLRHKESDRASVLVSELSKIGARIRVIGDRMEIEGCKLRGGKIDSHNDHRIAMAGAVAALTSEKGVEIDNEGCVAKSYPRFFEDLETLRVKK